MRGDIPRALLNNDIKRARELVADYQPCLAKIFIWKSRAIKAQIRNIPKRKDYYNERLIRLSKETGMPLVATADSHYLEREDAQAQDLLLCVGLGRTVQDTNRLDMRHAICRSKQKRKWKKCLPMFRKR